MKVKLDKVQLSYNNKAKKIWYFPRRPLKFSSATYNRTKSELLNFRKKKYSITKTLRRRELIKVHKSIHKFTRIRPLIRIELIRLETITTRESSSPTDYRSLFRIIFPLPLLLMRLKYLTRNMRMWRLTTLAIMATTAKNFPSMKTYRTAAPSRGRLINNYNNRCHARATFQ